MRLISGAWYKYRVNFVVAVYDGRMAYPVCLTAFCSSFHSLVGLRGLDSGQLQTLGRVLDHMLREYRDCLCRFRGEEIADKKPASARKRSRRSKPVEVVAPVPAPIPATPPVPSVPVNAPSSCSPSGPMDSESDWSKDDPICGEEYSAIDDLLKSLSG